MGSHQLQRPIETLEPEAHERPTRPNAGRTQNHVIRRREPVARNPAPVRRNHARLFVAAPPNPNYQIVTRNQARIRAQEADATTSHLGNLDSSDEEDQATEDTDIEPQVINPKCPICKSSVSNHRPVSMMCGHLFCRRCLKRSLRFKPECPVCRQFLTTKFAFIDVYF